MNGCPTKSPALEALDKVREAEERAKAIILEARERASVRIIKEAEEAAETAKQKALTKAKAEADARRKAVLDEARRGAEEIRAGTEAELENLRRRAGASLDEAVGQISSKVREALEKGSV
jgi:vacuolar-type H+-ATPase subunit H